MFLWHCKRWIFSFSFQNLFCTLKTTVLERSRNNSLSSAMNKHRSGFPFHTPHPGGIKSFNSVWALCKISVVSVLLSVYWYFACTPHVYSACVSQEKRYQIPWDWSYRWHWAAMWTLGIELSGPLNEQSVLSPTESSLQPEAARF